MRLALFFFSFLTYLFNNFLLGGELRESDEESLKRETEIMEKLSSEYAKFYDIPPGVELKDITEDLLNSPYVKEAQKQAIRHFNRRIVIFIYPSDGFKVKGLMSFVPDPQNHPLLIFLRGGNRMFGMLNPGGDCVCFEQYTVICTLYRGGVSEGEDEYGGEDVNDIKNLVDFIPELENQLGIQVKNQKAFLLGSSRGGMQMFLTLTRFPELQQRFSKIVSLSGVLDMRQFIAFRSDLEEMFITDFGLEKGVNEEEWINKRDPLLTANQILPELPILIIQGTDDNRINLEQGYNMVSRLQMAGHHNVTYWEIEGGKHCLSNREDRVELILRWLEQ